MEFAGLIISEKNWIIGEYDLVSNNEVKVRITELARKNLASREACLNELKKQIKVSNLILLTSPNHDTRDISETVKLLKRSGLSILNDFSFIDTYLKINEKIPSPPNKKVWSLLYWEKEVFQIQYSHGLLGIENWRRLGKVNKETIRKLKKEIKNMSFTHYYPLIIFDDLEYKMIEDLVSAFRDNISIRKDEFTLNYNTKYTLSENLFLGMLIQEERKRFSFEHKEIKVEKPPKVVNEEPAIIHIDVPKEALSIQTILPKQFSPQAKNMIASIWMALGDESGHPLIDSGNIFLKKRKRSWFKKIFGTSEPEYDVYFQKFERNGISTSKNDSFNKLHQILSLRFGQAYDLFLKEYQ